jgi:hypothetical protein
MTDKDIHIMTQLSEPSKTTDDNYGLLFPKFFTPTIEDKDGGKVITWRLIKGPEYIQGWVYAETPKKKWLRKPIMSGGHYTVNHSNLDRIHEFMDKYITYGEESHTKIKQYFLNETIRLLKDGGT